MKKPIIAAAPNSETIVLKPKLRGYLHQEAFFNWGRCLWSPNREKLYRPCRHCQRYLFFRATNASGISAFYHRLHWQPRGSGGNETARSFRYFSFDRRTVTPIGLLALPSHKEGNHLLWIVWITAIAGVLQSVFWVTAPKWVTAVFYVATGWLVLPFFEIDSRRIGRESVGINHRRRNRLYRRRRFYALKRPNFFRGCSGITSSFICLRLSELRSTFSLSTNHPVRKSFFTGE